MNHHIQEVQQHPAQVAIAFLMKDSNALLRSRFGNMVRDRFDMLRDTAIADDKEIRYGSELSQIHDHHILGFFLQSQLAQSNGKAFHSTLCQ